MRPLRHYIDQIEAHLPFKPSKWERKYQILGLCLTALFLIMTIVAFALHDQALIVKYLEPYARKVAEYPGAWLVPVIFLIVVSFPPLFGHELIAVFVLLQQHADASLTGIVWENFPVAFLLVASGSILGESLLFLSFRHFFHNRIVKFRKEHEDNYGTIVNVINLHKRWMIFLIRLSAIPSHFSTPLFSSIDEIEYREWLYMVIATSWKFAIPVYVGRFILGPQTSVLGTVLVFFSIIVTIGVAAYLYREFRAFKRHNVRLDPTFALTEGETEFEIAEDVDIEAGKQLERSELLRRTSQDDFFFDEDEEAGK